jgi:hypothetical protein
MKMSKSGVLALAILLCISHSEAKSTSGMDVLHQCKEMQSGNANFSSGSCAGFIEGVIDGIYYAAVQRSKTAADVRQPYCLLEEVTNEQIIAVFVKYLEDYPEKLHEPAAVLLVESLAKAFPCRH